MILFQSYIDPNIEIKMKCFFENLKLFTSCDMIDSMYICCSVGFQIMKNLCGELELEILCHLIYIEY